MLKPVVWTDILEQILFHGKWMNCFLFVCTMAHFYKILLQKYYIKLIQEKLMASTEVNLSKFLQRLTS